MPSPRGHSPVAVAEPVCGGLNLCGKFGVEYHGFEAHESLCADLDALAACDLIQEGGESSFGGLQTLLVRIAQIDGQGGPTGNHVDHIRLEAHAANGG